MSFAHPWVLLFLISVPILAFMIWSENQSSSLELSITGENNKLSNFLDLIAYYTPFILRLLAISVLIIALARPQFGQSYTNSKNLGLDIMFAVDTSQSMSALDLKLNQQSVDRLTVVKKILQEFIMKRSNDRLGMLVFADEAYTQCPITRDHGALLDLVNYIYIGMVGKSTAIGSAIAVATKRFKDLEAKSKILILMTDGMNTAGAISPKAATKLAMEYGIKVYTIGIGEDGEVPFRVETPFGEKVINQATIIDEEALIEIAEKTGGQYFRAQSTEELSKIYSEIDKLEKTEVEVKEYNSYKDIFEYFLWAALFIVLLEIILGQSLLKRL